MFTVRKLFLVSLLDLFLSKVFFSSILFSLTSVWLSSLTTSKTCVSSLLVIVSSITVSSLFKSSFISISSIFSDTSASATSSLLFSLGSSISKHLRNIVPCIAFSIASLSIGFSRTSKSPFCAISPSQSSSKFSGTVFIDECIPSRDIKTPSALIDSIPHPSSKNTFIFIPFESKLTTSSTVSSTCVLYDIFSSISSFNKLLDLW